jgi:hypothetical protein
MTPTYVAQLRDKESKLVLEKLLDFRQRICSVMVTMERLPYDGLTPIISPLRVSLYSCEQAIDQVFIDAGDSARILAYAEPASLFTGEVSVCMELPVLIDMRSTVEHITQDFKRFVALFPALSLEMTEAEIRAISQLVTASLWIQNKTLQLKSKAN